ncbi:n-acetylglutamate synthase [Rhizosphaericola mali]|uniref:N-acetylglutamate synthase n=1 Tax=Rhizosphaericola mali TaxID=2545455 RepID=A0A5P2G8L4_9BACT|nr:n-acetylglutamate synthase [Rhizosphaericola mali]QES90639.1 n-acetylglutamate synthase [Rhizosphaericola mali]
MQINYNGKKFKPISNTENGETSDETIFEYVQSGNFLHSNYSGGKIKIGHLIATVSDTGRIDMVYHHINLDGMVMTGKYQSVPEILPNGKIRLHEAWQWTNGDQSSGNSILDEII